MLVSLLLIICINKLAQPAAKYHTLTIYSVIVGDGLLILQSIYYGDVSKAIGNIAVCRFALEFYFAMFSLIMYLYFVLVYMSLY